MHMLRNIKSNMIKMSIKKQIIPLFLTLSLFGYAISVLISLLFNIDNELSSIIIKIFVMFLGIVFIVFYKKIFLSFNRYFILVFLLFALYLIRVMGVFLADNQIVEYTSDFKFISYLLGSILFPLFVIFSILRNKLLEPDVLFKYIFFALFGSLIVILYYLFVESGFNFSRRSMLEHLNPISLGNFGASLLLLSLYKCSYSCKKSKDFLYFFSLIIGIVTLLISFSKGPIVSFLVAFIIISYLKIGIRKTILFLIFVILIGSQLNSDIFTNIFHIFMNMFEVLNFNDSVATDESTSTRVSLYINSLEQFSNSPIFGSGIVELNSHSYPHNLLVEFLISSGIFGFILFFFLLGAMFYKSLILLKNDLGYGWISLLSFQYSVSIMFSGAIYNSVTFWILMGIVFVIKNSNNPTSEMRTI